MDNPPEGLRQRRRREKTAVLLAHAADLVVEGGMDNLTMPALAARAGVAVGGIYRYFNGKAALIAALQESAVRLLSSSLVVDGEGKERVRGLVMGVADFAADHPTPFLLLDQALSDPRTLLEPEDAARVTDAVEPILQTMDAALRDARLGGEDARQRTLVLWGVVFGLLQRRKLDARRSMEAHRHRALLTEALRALMAGWSEGVE